MSGITSCTGAANVDEGGGGDVVVEVLVVVVVVVAVVVGSGVVVDDVLKTGTMTVGDGICFFEMTAGMDKYFSDFGSLEEILTLE